MSANVSMEIHGVNSTVKILHRAHVDYLRAFAAALYAEGLIIIGQAVLRTPVDKGRLRASAYCSPPISAGTRFIVRLGFGVWYALIVHERMKRSTVRASTDIKRGADGRYLKSDTRKTGEAQWLRRALERAIPGFGSRLARRTQRYYNARIGVGAVPSGNMPKSAQAGSNRGGQVGYRNRKARSKRKSRKPRSGRRR